jgi:hypothetical protein
MAKTIYAKSDHGKLTETVAVYILPGSSASVSGTSTDWFVLAVCSVPVCSVMVYLASAKYKQQKACVCDCVNH